MKNVTKDYTQTGNTIVLKDKPKKEDLITLTGKDSIIINGLKLQDYIFCDLPDIFFRKPPKMITLDRLYFLYVQQVAHDRHLIDYLHEQDMPLGRIKYDWVGTFEKYYDSYRAEGYAII